MPLFLSVSKVGICACAVLLGCFIMAVDGTSCLDFDPGCETLVLNVSLAKCVVICQENSANCTTYAYQPETMRCKYFDQKKTTVGGEGWTVYQAAECDEYLVDGPDPVEDSAITASGYHEQKISHAPKWARLSSVACGEIWRPGCVSVGCWVADAAYVGTWIQVKLKHDALIKAVATRGRPMELDSQWVKEYTVSVSNDGTIWTPVLAKGGQANFVGNTEKYAIVVNALETPTMARFVRIYPTQWNIMVSMGFDVQGCYPATAEL